MSASRYVTSASRYQSRSSMHIRALIPRDSTELAEAVPIEFFCGRIIKHINALPLPHVISAIFTSVGSCYSIKIFFALKIKVKMVCKGIKYFHTLLQLFRVQRLI